MALDGVGRQTNQLDSSSGELGLQFGKSSKLGCAHRGVIFRVREKHDPVVADELMEVDGTLSGVGLEVGCDRAEAETEEKDKSVMIWPW